MDGDPGFKQYGNDSLGDEIAWSWLHTVNHYYKTHHKLIEKYHIASSTPREGGGGVSVAGWLRLDEWGGAAVDWAVWGALSLTLTLTLSPEGRGDLTVRPFLPRPFGERAGVRGKIISGSPHKWQSGWTAIFLYWHRAVSSRGALPYRRRAADVSLPPGRYRMLSGTAYA